MLPIILASNSPYRRALLDKLHLQYETQSPNIDETPQPHETASTLAARLAEAKARAIAKDHPNALIIGSDQAAQLGTEILGKPCDHEHATFQLQACQGQTVTFYTAICLINTRSGVIQNHTEAFKVSFRALTDKQISHYLHVEKPYDCAGSFKCEGFGITLFDKLEGQDPNSLIGLPLITLTRLLLNEGFDVLSPPDHSKHNQ